MNEQDEIKPFKAIKQEKLDKIHVTRLIRQPKLKFRDLKYTFKNSYIARIMNNNRKSFIFSSQNHL